MEMKRRKSMKTKKEIIAQIRDKRDGNEKDGEDNQGRRKIMKIRISRENSVKKRKENKYITQ
jgi:hypothetical protein